MIIRRHLAAQLLKIGLKIREREVTRLPVDQTGAAMFQPLCLLVAVGVPYPDQDHSACSSALSVSG